MKAINYKKKVIFWDVDGVIIDSMDECLFTSYNVFRQMSGIPEIVNLGDIPQTFVMHFHHNRKHVRPAGEYFLVHQALIEGRDIETADAFQQFALEHKNILPVFQQHFFEFRDTFRAENPLPWQQLHRLYPHIPESWAALRQSFQFVVISNKDSKSIRLILEYFGLLKSVKGIYGGDINTDKRVLIGDYLATHKILPSKALFIDDHPGHLLHVAPVGLMLGYADWGYGTHIEGMEMAFTVLSPRTLIDQVHALFKGKN